MSTKSRILNTHNQDASQGVSVHYSDVNFQPTSRTAIKLADLHRLGFTKEEQIQLY